MSCNEGLNTLSGVIARQPHKKLQVDRYPITPVPAPRQVRSHAWKPTAGVLRYRKFKDIVRDWGVEVASGDVVLFGLPMAKSWSKKKQGQHDKQPHQQKPDIDNLLKALLDAIYDEDQHIHTITAHKYWVRGDTGEITVIRGHNAIPSV